MDSIRLRAAREYLGLNRNVAVLALSIFGLGLGEELWQSYLPKYLTALGASGVAVGLFTSLKDLLDGLYQYPGGWAGDRFGRKRALMLFTLTAMCGYALYALAWHWVVVFIGLALVMAWKAGAFIVLYVMNVLEYSAPVYGALYALQQTVSLVMYLPSGRLADLTGRRSLIALTFLFFALFPLAMQWAHGFTALVAAFVIGGLKEMGEPARKALIVDLADPSERARAVSVYYTIRNLLIVPAGTIGGILWTYSPQSTLQVAGAVGMLGVAVFWITSRERPV